MERRTKLVVETLAQVQGVHPFFICVYQEGKSLENTQGGHGQFPRSGGNRESEYEALYIALMADEYKTVLTGGLSLKGGLFKSKKKKKAKRKRDEAEAAVRAQEAANADDLSSGSAAEDVDPRSSGSDGVEDRDDPKAEESSENIDDMLTPAQRRFRERQLSREGKKIRNMVEKTHRERVEDFNALLASMTEHNDIPRCSAAGNG